jgi:predicted alpha-1,2-mannosidase
MKNSTKTFYSIKIGLIFCAICLNLSDALSQHVNKQHNDQLTKYVNPFIGTAEHGHVFLGANVPFGLVQLGPSNAEEGWDWCSGYNYSSNSIVGFTHTHLSGTGIGDLNDILIMPTTGKLHLNNGIKQNLSNSYLSTFSHSNEKCEPGYYSVLLDKYNIKAELTASERVGFHQYTFYTDDTANIIINLNYGKGWDNIVNSSVQILNDSTIVGYRYSTGWAVDQRIYFSAIFSKPFLKSVIYQSDTLLNSKKAQGDKLQAILKFHVLKNSNIKLKVALSPVSIENALLNLKTEISDWNFIGIRNKAKSKWNDELKKIQIDATDSIKQVFYTSIYHTAIAPSLFNDVNKDYLGTDKKIVRHVSFNNYTTFSLWDTYRALNPLYTIMQPNKINDIIQTFLAIYQQQGRLPVWHLMGNETDCMNGNHSIPVIVDAYFKGFRNYDIALAYAAVKSTAMQNRAGMSYVKKIEYIPADTLAETVANALEYAIDDWCVAKMAKALNRMDDYNYFFKRSQLYKQYFDVNSGFMRGKLSNGKWREPFDPVFSKHRTDDYVEGNAWQYTWLVPHDPHGLIKLFGSDALFTKKLDSLFTISSKLSADASPDISGLIGQYAQGNEPNHHTPYLYSFAGQPWKTARIVRQIIDTFYTAKTNGLCGNEDVGQMSAWYVFSSMGFYPVNPANGVYVLGSPAVNSAIIPVSKGKTFKLTAVNNSKSNIYIQSATYNGKAYTKSFITHEMIMQGGELKLYMSNSPSARWGVALKDRP